MAEIEDVIAENRKAIEHFLAAARKVPPEKWAQPVAPGKWSPAQIVDHIAVTTEVALKAINGDASMGSIPKFLRFIPRKLGFDPTITRGRFPEKQRGPAVFAPSKGNPSYETSVEKLNRAMAALETHVRGRMAKGEHFFEHSFFGRVSIPDYIRFGTLHVQHHERQLPTS
jgi:hypothetical protein